MIRDSISYYFALIGVFTMLYSSVGSQVLFTDTISHNNVKASVNNTSGFFSIKNTNQPFYEVPKGSGKNLFYSASIMCAGIDNFGELRSAVTLFSQGRDFFPGPHSSNESYTTPEYNDKYAKSIWKVSKSDIVYHIDNYNQPNYKAPDGILNWPGNGDTTLGTALNLAPYIDVNGDGVYNPYDGDYPCIKGDASAYIILNDMAFTQNETYTDNMGIEMHLEIYQFSSNDYIDTSTFISAKIINRGNIEYDRFKCAFYADPDVGFAFNDYIGCDINKNVGYAYNATVNDPVYGDHPPAVGVVSLNRKMESFMKFKYGGPGILPTPISSYHTILWRMMNGRWFNNNPLYFGGSGKEGSLGATSLETNYIYSGNSMENAPWNWTEHNLDGNGAASPIDEDKRFLLVPEEIEFYPGDTAIFDFAIVQSRIGTIQENIQGVLNNAELVKSFYDSITSLSCEVLGTGIADYIPSASETNYDLFFEITRWDGQGNSSLPIKTHPKSEAEILNKNKVDTILYQRGYGPIDVELIDTINYAQGYYELKVTGYDMENAKYTIYRYDKRGGDILDSIVSMYTLSENEPIFAMGWGLKIDLKHLPHECPYDNYPCPPREQHPEILYSALKFADTNKRWLTGVKDNLGFNQNNWISSGNYIMNETIIDPDVTSPHCYMWDLKNDPKTRFNNLVDGRLSASYFTRLSSCSNLLSVTRPIFVSAGAYRAFQLNNQQLPIQPNIDIVITKNKDLWTRCPVIEMHNDENTALQQGTPGLLRASPSVDKHGNPDGTGTGMGWFPGYAVDVETGERLNMAFGENSFLMQENGGDMVWNPTSKILNSTGQPRMGGQHVIYVFNNNIDGMPLYDEGEFIREKLELKTAISYRSVYRNLAWVYYPLLEEGHSLLETDVRISVRLNKYFALKELSGKNNGRPMFSWEVGEYRPQPVIDEAYIHIFPNPATQNITIEWANKIEFLEVFGMDGKKVIHQKVAKNTMETVIDITHLRSGLYIVRAGKAVGKLLVAR